MSITNRKSTLASFYANSGLREIIPIYPLYAVMFGDNGISPIELASLFFLWGLVGLVTEIPSGAWADTYSRKWLVVASGLFKSLAFLAWYLWQDFPGYALGFVLWGFGSTLRSGAYEALLHDLLHDWGQSHLFTKHYGRIRALGTLAVGAGQILGGMLIIHGYDTVLLASMAIPLIATLPFILYVSDVRRDAAAARVNYLAHLKQGTLEALQNKTILFILLVTTFLLITYGVFDEFVPPILREKGFSLSQIAYFAAPIYFAQSLGEFLASRFVRFSLDQLLMLMMFASICLFPVYWLTGYALPAMIAIFFFSFGLCSTLFASLLQQKIESSSRATVTSMVGLGDSVGSLIWFPIFGIMAETTSMTGATLGFSLIIILLCCIARRLLIVWAIR